MPLDTTQEKHQRAAPAQAAAPLSETVPKRGWLSGLPAIPRKLRPWLIAGVLAVLALGAWAMFGSGAKKSEIVTAAVTRGDIEQTVLATGVLEPAKLVSVGAQASGQVKKLYVELGDTVKQGDPIAEIDSRTQSNTVSNAQAGLANQRAQRSAAAANLTEAQLNYDRQKRLYQDGAAARADYETAQSQLASAKASLAAVDAQIKQASLSLNTAETNLGYTNISAPMDGTIVAVVTEEGQTVNANQSAPTIVKLAQLDSMTVSAEISEADIEKVDTGQIVYFTTLGDPNKRHYAKLRTIAPAPDSIESDNAQTASSATASAVYYNGLFDVENKDGKLKTGMTAQVYVVLASAKNTLLIPSSALEGRGRRGAYTVKVVDKGGKIEERKVKVGINTNVSAQVLEGLKEGDKVVVAEASPQPQNAQRNNQQRNPLAMGAGGGRRGFGGGGRGGGPGGGGGGGMP
jgi:macrolide-specific efflux system membrane fusion protein